MISFLHPAAAVKAAGIHEGMTVADFGTGSGFFARAAAAAVGEGGHVWAVDANRDLLLRLKTIATAEGSRNVDIVAGDVENAAGSNLPDDSMDFVIAANILFSAEDREVVASEIWRVLKPGRSALVIDWKDSFSGLGPPQKHVVTEAAARRIFEQGGFTVTRAIPAGDFHWGFVVKKKAR